jgi:ATP-dependent DNA helicase DinG
VISTATKALQDQLATRDLPTLRESLGIPFEFAVLKGRSNYICMQKVTEVNGQGDQMVLDHSEEAPPEAEQLGPLGRQIKRLILWAETTTETGDRAELELEPSDAFWSELAVGSDRCSGRRCAFHGTCFTEAARDRASSADLVIANHALYFADLAAGGGVLPEHDAVVFDEAHRLEESAASWLGGGVSRAGLRRLALDVERACRERRETLPQRALDQIERSGERLLAAVAPPSGRRRLRQTPREEAVLLGEALGALAMELQGSGEELDALARRSLQMAAQVEALLDPDEQ